jgi:hypothetical protein
MNYAILTELKEISQSFFRGAAVYFLPEPHFEELPSMFRAFTQHPASVGETYLEHMGMALSFALRLLLGGLACFVHAFLPFLFVKTGSGIIAGLHDRMVVTRCRHGVAAVQGRAPASATADPAR